MKFADKFFEAKRFHLYAGLVIALAILIAYSNTFTASFHFDDSPNIQENPYIKTITIDNLKRLLYSTRPIVNLTLLLNYQLNGLNVVGWHIFNNLLHIVNSLLVYFLIYITLNLPSLAGKYSALSKRMALFGALLFGVHPIQTESVTYIISRTELIAAFFYLSTIILFIRWHLTGKKKYIISSVICAFLAMGSKEHAVTLPAILFLYDLVFIGEGSLRESLKRIKAHAAVASSWVFLAILLLSVPLQGAGFNVSEQDSNITPLTYLFTQFNVIWTYIRLLFLPINQNLDYDYPIAKTLFEFPTFLSLIGHLLVTASAIYLYKKKRWLIIPFCIAWFYIILSPTSSFVPILDVIFEHRLYLPSVGFFFAFVTAYEGIFEWIEKRRLAKNAQTDSLV